MKVNKPRHQSKHSRRRFLSGIPAFGLFLMEAPRLSAAQPRETDWCSITAADSLLAYQRLLDEAEMDSISETGKRSLTKLQECGETLGKVQSLLRKLENAIKVKSSTTLMDDFKSLMGESAGGVRLANISANGRPDPQLIEHLDAMNESTISALLKISSDCDLSNDSEVRSIVQDMLDALKAQNDNIVQYRRSVDTWNKSADDLRRIANKIRELMAQASMAISANVDNSPGTGKPSLVEAVNALSRSKSLLNNFLEHDYRSPKQVLQDLLGATIVALSNKENRPILELTSYPVSEEEMSGSFLVPSVNLAESRVMDKIYSIIHDSRYFRPPTGGFWTATTCVTICLPAWLGISDVEKRTTLIQGCLAFVPGTISTEYKALAHELANAHP